MSFKEEERRRCRSFMTNIILYKIFYKQILGNLTCREKGERCNHFLPTSFTNNPLSFFLKLSKPSTSSNFPPKIHLFSPFSISPPCSVQKVIWKPPKRRNLPSTSFNLRFYQSIAVKQINLFSFSLVFYSSESYTTRQKNQLNGDRSNKHRRIMLLRLFFEMVLCAKGDKPHT